MECEYCGKEFDVPVDGKCPACHTTIEHFVPAGAAERAPLQREAEDAKVVLPPPFADEPADDAAREPAAEAVAEPVTETAAEPAAEEAAEPAAEIAVEPAAEPADEPEAPVAAELPPIVPPPPAADMPLDANAGRGPGARGSATNAKARAKLIELLKDEIPTVAVVGSSDVGKSWFIDAIADIAEENDGFLHRKRIADDSDDVADATQENLVQPGAGAARRLQRKKAPDTTTVIWVHYFWRNKDNIRFRIIDIPGEFFVMAREIGIENTADDRVAMLYPVVAAAGGFILLIRTPDIFDGSEVPLPDVTEAPSLLQSISNLCHLIDGLKLERDLPTAIAHVFALSVKQRSDAMDKQSGRSSRPAVILLSQSDKCFGLGNARVCENSHIGISEIDPLLCVARKAKGLINKLDSTFEKHKIDFLTADENGDRRTPEQRRVQYGAWSAMAWMLRQIEPPARKTGLPRILQICQQPFDRYRHKSEWVLNMRKRGDAEFRRRMDQR